MPETMLQEQNNRFCEIMQKIDRLYEKYAKAKGMTYMSMTVLESISANKENCTQKLICEETHYPKQSVNLIVKSFLQDGYITLEELPEDRRNKRIVLTEKGRLYADETIGGLWEIDKNATLQMSAKQREELLQLLSLYTNAYEQGILDSINANE